MKNSKEIEIKLIYKNKNSVINALTPKIQFLKKIFIKDTYYGFTDTEMKNSNNIIRIRTIDGNNSELTFKNKVANKNNIWLRKEVTVGLSSANQMEKILKCLGIKKYYKYINEKECWIYDNLEIVFSKYSEPAQLEFMEVEGQSEKEIRQITKKIAAVTQVVNENFFKVFDEANLKKRGK